MENNCEITKLLRGNCTACRLKKCFALGMDPNLVGQRCQNHHRSLKIINKKKNQLPQVY